MNQNPNKRDEENDEDADEETLTLSTCVPLTVMLSGFINSLNFYKYILKAMEVLVFGYFTYQLLGKFLFVGIIGSICLVVFVYNCCEIYYAMQCGDDDDMDDDDPHFNDHWDNLTKK